ncbi:MAG: J domain-containing protein [Deltaproteobacteria bacterium]|nr:J domain-containing protein [Deltaproteobacteria bacterium]MBW2067728.1 J domain-containing protein [Deltaproteobacteria bacterium]
MYLRKIQVGPCAYHYIIRESYWNGTCWTYRDLIDLGSNPGSHIHYVGGNGFYFNEFIEERLDELGVNYTSEDLEEIFFPFLKPHIQRILYIFGSSRRTSKNKWHNYSEEKLFEEQKDIHSFDKRRLHFLRCGRVDIGNLNTKAWKFLNILLEKSRDEREAIIEKMEAQLRPREVKSYVYTALNLQEYFSTSILKNHPLALDAERIDEAFLDAICRLNRDREFFRGVPDHDPKVLHPYLKKYVIYFYDYEFGQSIRWDEFIRGIFGSQEHRAYKRMRSRVDIGLDDACSVLGIKRKELKSMSRKELKRIYKKKARETHPDTGGEHEAFIRLTEAYHKLMMHLAS